jgi:hypothetical protein
LIFSYFCTIKTPNHQSFYGEKTMGYKNTQSSFGFADLALNKTLQHNRSLETMERLDKAINWKKIESILLSHYIPGTSSEGAGTYHPMLLYKSLLLQK